MLKQSENENEIDRHTQQSIDLSVFLPCFVATAAVVAVPGCRNHSPVFVGQKDVCLVG